LIFSAVLLLSACAEFPVLTQIEPQDAAAEAPEGATPTPPPNARTVEQFDTTTEEQRAAAAAPSAGGRSLGTTVASLGNAADPGFWMETSLVSDVTLGRVVFPVNGKEVEVELRSSDGGSSRISLAALRLLEAPLTELVTLEVYAN
jgi:hypothetical protein